MQIPSVPPPLITNPSPQDLAAKAIPQTQAVAPLVARAVNAPPKSEKSNQNRSNKDKGHQEDPQADKKNGGENERGSAVNFDV
jgi:hypothetical protein